MPRGHDGHGQKESAQASTDQDRKHRIVGRIEGIHSGRGDKGTGSGAKEWSMDKSVPAGSPDVPALIQIAALKLFRDGGQTLNRSAGNDKPESGGERRQSKYAGNHALDVGAGQEDAATHQCHDGGQKTSAGGCDQHGEESQRQITQRQQAARPAAFADKEQRGKGKTQVEKARYIVRILSGGRKSDLAGIYRLRRSEIGNGKSANT